MSEQRCEDCERRLDRPPYGARLFEDRKIGCKTPESHAVPDAAQRAVELIESDLNDRYGLKHEWRHVEPHIQDEIRDEWANIIRKQFAPETMLK